LTDLLRAHVQQGFQVDTTESKFAESSFLLQFGIFVSHVVVGWMDGKEEEVGGDEGRNYRSRMIGSKVRSHFCFLSFVIIY
jgi:hypothetical protein